MALNVIVKNTFLDLDESDHSLESVTRKRSSSVPRTWKLRADSISGTESVVSTSASDVELSDGDSSFETPLLRSQALCGISSSGGSACRKPSPLGCVQKGLYMQWEGKITDMVLPHTPKPAAVSHWTSKLNPTAAEFKMPAPIDDAAFQTNTGTPPVIMLPSPMTGQAWLMLMMSPGGSCLNPKAKAFEPGTAPNEEAPKNKKVEAAEDEDSMAINVVGGA
eukprot:CAMPEP_0203845912 /NCGR_PEP_ID=MMETSP0359-20131031/4109_1 /ASSEMBLY_ACC=CAM_ASM_000338 /TAXON_ID=268821 /ORGANISM="Scrippsiella Hangoei, Strain SHTV-5" /LENGTH=220 /DNA_ID=CAMNT_0050761151 /DNA_START=54 /DNA_END=716 /DNA_ORIENTATION=+